jgi:hypothetical protein
MAINVPIVSQWNPKGVNSANKSLSGFDKTVKTLGKSIAGVFAAQKIVSFFAASVKGAMEDQKAQIQLAKSIRNTTNATSQQIAGVEDFIRTTQFATGILDDNLRPAFNRLVLATSDVEKSQKLMTLALDISAGTGKDLESVTAALAKAAGGQFTALQRLGVGLSKTVMETKDLDTITGVLATKFSGQAAAAAQTFAGQMAILNAKAQDAQETIGFAFIEAIQMFSGTGGAGKAFGDLLLVIADNFANLIVGIATVIKSVQDFTRSLEQSNPTLFRFVEALGNVAVLIFKLGTLPLTFFTEAGEKTRDLAKTNKLAGDRYQLMAEKLYGFKSATENTLPSIDKATKKIKGLTDAQKAVIEANIKIQDSIVNNLQESLNSAESALDSVRGKFDDLRDTISNSVTDVVDFGAAIETENFLQAIENQASGAKTFAEKVKQLIQLGLSERGIRELLDSGYEAGALIADQLIAGGTTIVNQVNTLLDSVDSVARTVGQLGAETFYQQGVSQGEALVAGIKAALESARAELDRLRASLTVADKTVEQVSSTTDTGSSVKPVVVRNPVPKTIPGTSLTQADVNKILANPVAQASAARYQAMANTRRFAKGGIVTGPTVGMIGEAGPEAIVPLTGKNSKAMGTTFNITVNAGIGTSGAEVGRQIVDAIKKYERNSGPVFASV